MKDAEGIIRKYGVVLGLVSLLVFLFVYTTLPSIEMNRYLNRVRKKRLEEIDTLQNTEKRYIHLREALERDPITIENHLRRQFGGAKGEEELEIDRLSK